MSATPTAITIAASVSQAVYGQDVTLTADVTAAPTDPAIGTVTFMDGGVALGSPVAVNTSGEASLDVTLNAGSHNITASYHDSSDSYTDSSTTVQGSSLINTVAGDGTAGYTGDNGPATSAELHSPIGVAVDSAGDIFIAAYLNNVVREVDHATGKISTVVASAAGLYGPRGVAVNAAGSKLFIADTFNDLVREVDLTTGIITTVAGEGNPGYSGDNGQATSAELDRPESVALDSTGANLYIADTDNSVIREVNLSSGVITTVAGNGTAGFSGDNGAATFAELAYPHGVAVDSSGNVFIADAGNNRIREVNASNGEITTVAGNGTAGFSGDNGSATSAELSSPQGIAVDANGTLFIADLDNCRVREVTTATGTITTVAGNGTFGYGGDGGAAASAGLMSPTRVAINSDGSLFIADADENRIREVSVGIPLTITQATLTITPDNKTKVYGDANPALTASYWGFVNSDSAADLTTAPTLLTSATAASSVAGGPYAITAGGAVDGNYTIAYVGGALTVTPAPLTITADNQIKVSGAAVPTLTASYTGFVNGDTPSSLTTLPALSTTAVADSPVSGSPYPITVSGAADSNYTVLYVSGSLFVTPAPVAVDDVYVIGSGMVTVVANNGVLVNDAPSSGLTVNAGTVVGAEGGTFTFNADGSFTYNPPVSFPGYDQAQYTLSDSHGDTTSATVTILSQPGGVAWKTYESVLGRAPDDAGLKSWIAYLSGGGTTGDMVAAFAQSDELLDRVIGGYYQQYLGREADPAGLDGWKSVWRATGGPKIVEANIAASPEFFHNAGGTKSGWLTAIYERVLNRTPDAQGFNNWVERLTSGTTEVNVVLAFIESPEAFSDDVTTWFEQDFGMKPQAEQLDFYVGQMLVGSSNAAIEQELASNPVYSATVPTAAAGTAVRLSDYLTQPIL